MNHRPRGYEPRGLPGCPTPLRCPAMYILLSWAFILCNIANVVYPHEVGWADQYLGWCGGYRPVYIGAGHWLWRALLSQRSPRRDRDPWPDPCSFSILQLNELPRFSSPQDILAPSAFDNIFPGSSRDTPLSIPINIYLKYPHDPWWFTDSCHCNLRLSIDKI